MIKITRKLHKINAEGKSVGRLATQIALILRGKNKTEYLPHLDMGDMVQIINIKKIKLTGKKIEQKKYYKYSGYPGGLKTKKIQEVLEKNPSDVLKKAVRDMLPPTKHRTNMLKRLIIN